MNTQKAWKIIAVVAIILCIYSYLSFEGYYNHEEGIIYSPSTQTVFTAFLASYCFGKPWDHLNPFRKIKRNNLRYMEYGGKFVEIQQAKELFDRMGENDPNEALRYLRRPRPIEISRLYPFVKARPIINAMPEKLLPSQWKFLLNSDIDKSDLAVIDIVMLPDKTQSSEGVLYLPRCLLLKGRAVVLLANEGYSNFRGKIIRK